MRVTSATMDARLSVFGGLRIKHFEDTSDELTRLESSQHASRVY